MKIIRHKEKTFYFVSTAHVSKQSVLEVKETIESIQPQAVCIELDDKRHHALTNPSSYHDVDIRTIIKQKRVGAFLANLILSSYQKKMADSLDTKVGQEMLQAIESASVLNIPVINIDRDVQITFKRIWGNLSFFKKISLITSLIFSVFEKDDISNEDIENLKESDLLYEAVKELDEKLPNVSQSLLHERNFYMAEKLKMLPYDSCVVVIGAAHTQGLIEALDDDHSIAELTTVPEKKKTNWGGWVIPTVLVLLLIILTFKNPSMGLRQLGVWFALSGGLATLGAVFVGAHPFTVLTTLATAWIGTLSPFLAVGMFASLMEAYQRPPRVSDFDSLSEDVSQPKMWFKNKVLRLLLIFIVTNLLSSIGTFIAGGSIIRSLFRY